jgi:Ca-activated chloride channel homolog
MNSSSRLWRSFLALGCLCLFGSFTAAQAQGIILPRPCEREAVRCAPPEWQQPLQLKSIRISTKITDQAAITHIEQVFENRSPHQLEGTYFFPLPDEVSISEFAMWDGNKRLVGEFRSREEARRIYDNIVRSRRDPALLEYAGKNLFQASVFPIAPHSEKKIELTYSQILRNDTGTVSYRYPLGTGWRANGFGNVIPPPRPVPMPRPIRPQIETPLPPGSNEGGVLSAEIEISSRTPLKNIYSPSHDIEIKRTGEQKARITLEHRMIGAQPDLQLFYSLSEQDFGVSLLTHREPGKDGYFMLLVSPKAELDKQQTTAKEIVFVVDTSGSMSDDNKIGKAKAALRFGVNSLNARDRFNIVSFAGEEHLLAESLIAADNQGKQNALDFIEGLKATGGTNINDALLAALKQLRKSELPQMVVLLTDGQPTVGTTNANSIISNTVTANKTNARVFTFGVGYDVNTVLLDALANEQRGTVAYVEPKEDLEIKVSSFFSKVNNPVLSDLQIDWGGMDTELVYPRQMPDIFHGSQLVLVGRYRPQGKRVSMAPRLGGSNSTFLFAMPTLAAFMPATTNATNTATTDPRNIRLTLTGKANGQTRRFVYDNLAFPETARDNEFVPQLWAMRRVAHLLDQIKRNGEAKELREEIVELGTRYGIVTPYTSALVLEPGMSVEGDMRRISMGTPAAPMVRKVERADERARMSGATETVTITADNQPIPHAVAGQAAVSQSINNATLRQADNLQVNQKLTDKEGGAAGKINRIAGKTFYFANNVWSDSEYKPDAKLPEVKIKFASDAYYKLLKDEPRLAEFLAQGTNVTVVWNGKVYLVTE